MKKTILLIIPLFLLACGHGTPEYVDLSDYVSSQHTLHVVSEGDVNMDDVAPWESFSEAYFPMDDTIYLSAQPTQTTAARKATSTDIISVARGLIEMFVYRKVHQVVATYVSVDVDGNPITVSGKVFYPKNGNIKNMILVSHFTIGANFEAPSETFSLEGIYAAMGYMVVIPDYIGFGVTAEYIHPYLQADNTAATVIDMGTAAMSFAAQRHLPLLNDSVILLGYSQGGATTLHVQRLLETYPEYIGALKIKKNYAGAGPYDIARTYDYSIKQDKTGIPCACAMIIQGASIGMPKPLDMKDFFKEPLYSNYDNWINSKRYTVKQMNLLMGVDRLSDIITESARDKSNSETMRLYKELKENSIPPYYYPEAPLYMFHSEDDTTVPFQNSQIMQRQFRTADCVNVEYDFDHYGNHMKGAMKFIIKCAQMLK